MKNKQMNLGKQQSQKRFPCGEMLAIYPLFADFYFTMLFIGVQP